MKNVDILIIGGGAAGLMAASIAAKRGCSVMVVEKRFRCGSKLLITGKGRCNLTNTRPWDKFSNHIHPDASFFKNAFYSFSNIGVINFFEENGMPTIVERGHRVFPASGRSSDVLETLLKTLKKGNVEVMVQGEVKNAFKDENGLFKVMFMMEDRFLGKNGTKDYLKMEIVTSKCLIVATGGLSYPITGSTGFGYELAKSFGHTIVDLSPSLTALRPFQYDRRLEGNTLYNVRLDLIIDDMMAQSEMGELSFTDGGIEGALGLRVSRMGVKALNEGRKVRLEIDLKPAVDLETLSKRVTKEMADILSIKRYSEYKANGNMSPLFKTLIRKFLPQPLVIPFIEGTKNLSLLNLPSKLKCWQFPIEWYVGYERAVVTAGGVSLNEVSRKTMESKLVEGLYFVGEVLNLDGDTGGYNLQIAFSTANLAALSAANKVESNNIKFKKG